MKKANFRIELDPDVDNVIRKIADREKRTRKPHIEHLLTEIAKNDPLGKHLNKEGK